jgi:hypothetical protein
MDKNNASLTLNFKDDTAIECFNKFKEKHGFETDAEVLRTAYLMMLSLDEENKLQFLKNGKFMILAGGKL